jgi:hypothetical protein
MTDQQALDDAVTCGNIACMAAEKHGAENLKELLRKAGLRLDRLRGEGE